MLEIERVKTGIPGFDELVYGGIPKRNIVLLSGGPGTGKSIFAQQFLFNGLLQKESGILVTLEEHPVQLRRNMLTFGWDVKSYEENNMFAIVDAFTGGIGETAKKEKYVVRSVDDVSEFLDTIRKAVKEVEAQRVV
ncbi:MAG: ATPase domain-containing protein, partial [Candidatus Aenigmatarchaeota archaeon]